MLVFLLSTLFLLGSSVTYNSVGLGFCADSNSLQLSYVAIENVPDAQTCELYCSSTSSCNGYLLLSSLGCFLYGDTTALSSSLICSSYTCSSIINDGGSVSASGVAGGPQVDCLVKQLLSVTYSEVGGGFCANINRDPISYVAITDISDDAACGEYCSCTETCQGYLRLSAGNCFLYGDTYWLLNDVPCVTPGVTCNEVAETNDGPPADILNNAPTTCFAKDYSQPFASFTTVGNGFCADDSLQQVQSVRIEADQDWSCLMYCSITSECLGYNYLNGGDCYLFGTPADILASNICGRTSCTEVSGTSNSITTGSGPPTTTCFLKSTHHIDHAETTGLCVDSSGSILSHVTTTDTHCESLCSSITSCTHYTLIGTDTCILYGDTVLLDQSASCKSYSCDSSNQQTDVSNGNCQTKLTYSEMGTGFCIDSNGDAIASMVISTTSEQVCQQFCTETLNCIGFSYLATTDFCYLNGYHDGMEAESVCQTQTCSRASGTYHNVAGAGGPPTTSCWQKNGATIITPSPTSVPSSFPTTVPTVIPSKSPSTAPTVLPSSFPSVQPTDIPTKVPTTLPTDQPTLLPTDEPTTSSNFQTFEF